MEKKTKIKFNSFIKELIPTLDEPITIEIEAYLPEEDGKFTDKLPVTINLFKNFLEYQTHYNIEKEFVFEENDGDDPVLNKSNPTENKPLKCEDQGILEKQGLTITRTVENVLQEPGQGTSLLYRVVVSNFNEVVTFNFKNKTSQCNVYNQLVKWKYE